MARQHSIPKPGAATTISTTAVSAAAPVTTISTEPVSAAEPATISAAAKSTALSIPAAVFDFHWGKLKWHGAIRLLNANTAIDAITTAKSIDPAQSIERVYSAEPIDSAEPIQPIDTATVAK